MGRENRSKATRTQARLVEEQLQLPPVDVLVDIRANMMDVVVAAGSTASWCSADAASRSAGREPVASTVARSGCQRTRRCAPRTMETEKTWRRLTGKADILSSSPLHRLDRARIAPLANRPAA